MALAIILTRTVAALAFGLVVTAVWYLSTVPLVASSAGLMRAEVLVLGGVLALSVLFFERVALRLIRTRGGRLRLPPNLKG